MINVGLDFQIVINCFNFEKKTCLNVKCIKVDEKLFSPLFFRNYIIGGIESKNRNTLIVGHKKGE